MKAETLTGHTAFPRGMDQNKEKGNHDGNQVGRKDINNQRGGSETPGRRASFQPGESRMRDPSGDLSVGGSTQNEEHRIHGL